MRKAQERVFEATALILAITLFFAALCGAYPLLDEATAQSGRYTIDRIEGEFACLERFSDKEMLDFPVKNFPFMVQESDIIYYCEGIWQKSEPTAFDLDPGTYQITIAVTRFSGQNLHIDIYGDTVQEKHILSEGSITQKTYIINLYLTESSRLRLDYDGTLEAVKITTERM